VGLNSSSVNRCASWVPLTETPQVTVLVSQHDQTILATMPLRTTSLLKMMRPYTILYDASMLGNRKASVSPGQRAGIGLGIALAVIGVFAGTAMLLYRCRVKSKASKAVRLQGEAESANMREHEGNPYNEDTVVNHLEAPNSEVLEADSRRINELQVNANHPPCELQGVHQTYVEMLADSNYRK
jgi:hypothetical protein